MPCILVLLVIHFCTWTWVNLFFCVFWYTNVFSSETWRT